MFKFSSFPAQLFKASLLALAAVGIALPGVSRAQLSPSATSITSQPVLADGIYLFGQSPNPNESGSDYAVFSVKENKTVGAFYQPNSSFDCFSGEISPSRMAVNIVESYTQESYPYAIAVALDNDLTAGNAVGAYTLKGFHRIDTLSAQDHEILAVCEADLAK